MLSSQQPSDHTRSTFRSSILKIIGLFLFFQLFRALDIFWLRLDEEFGDILLSKSISFIFIIIFIVFTQRDLGDIGLRSNYFNYFLGLGFGFVLISIIGMRVAYSIIDGSMVAWLVVDVSLTFVYFTFFTNLVNVMMEESLFRGIFLRMSLDISRGHFWKANLLQAFVFGTWHLIWPVKEYMSGSITASEASIFAFTYFLFSFLVAIPWGYYYFKTRSLIMPLIWHLCWNTILGILPLPETNIVAYLISFIVGLLIALTTIPIFDRVVSTKYIDELRNWEES